MRRVSSRIRIDSNLTDTPDGGGGRQVCIVTTASVPWMTGTAVNPLLRAVYLAHETTCKVTLVLPWLSKDEQAIIFPNGLTFDSPSQQAEHIREWVLNRCKFAAAVEFAWYPARYDRLFFSISPAQGCSIIDAIPVCKRDIAILEEPEHLNWWERTHRWTDMFKHVVGIMHTNYYQYVLEQAGPAAAGIIKRTTTWLTRIHTHKVIKLSDAIQELPRSVTEFTHGVANGFLEVGMKAAVQRGQQLTYPHSSLSSENTSSQQDGAEGCAAASSALTASRGDEAAFDKSAYFIGKAVWGKGYHALFDRMKEAKDAGSNLHLDCFGSGEDLEEIKAEAQRLDLDVSFLGAIDHLSPKAHGYKVLVNASLSDVVATTTAEALAMGKWVLVAKHPENAFFEQFVNCLVYHDADDFVRLWKQAVENAPPPLTQEDFERLTWENATQRLLRAAAISAAEWPSSADNIADAALWQFYRPWTGLEVLSRALGKHRGGRIAQADLQRLAELDPELGAAQPTRQPKAVRFSLSHIVDGWRLRLGGAA